MPATALRFSSVSNASKFARFLRRHAPSGAEVYRREDEVYVVYPYGQREELNEMIRRCAVATGVLPILRY